MQESLTATNNPLQLAFERGEPISQDAPIGFACRGCGHRCCVNMDVLVSPPEAARILWHLERHPDLAARIAKPWGTMQLGGSSGLPLTQLRFVPLGDDLNRCPFLSPVYNAQGEWQQMAWCAIRAVRPAVCRLYPLGRVTALGDDGRAGEQDYRIIDRCAGFEPAPVGPLPPRYTPPGNQTVRQWVSEQVNADQTAEKTYYLTVVVPAFVTAHMHAPTDDNPGGVLSESDALELGRTLMYDPPAPPPDPGDDHAFLMAWLGSLARHVPELAAALKA